MLRRIPIPAWWAALMLACLPCRTLGDEGDSVAPINLPAEEVVRHLLDRAESLSNRLSGVCYACRRATLTEELDSRGAPKNRRTKEQQVRFDGLDQAATLKKVN